jgi:acyl carrier protein
MAVFDVNTKELIRQFIVDNFMFGDEGDLADEDSLIASGIMDSTGVLELVTFIEEKFAFKMDDVEMTPENLDGIHRIVTFVAARTSSQEA